MVCTILGLKVDLFRSGSDVSPENSTKTSGWVCSAHAASGLQRFELLSVRVALEYAVGFGSLLKELLMRFKVFGICLLPCKVLSR